MTTFGQSFIKVMEDTGPPMSDNLGITDAPGGYASHHPDTLGFPHLYIDAHQFCTQKVYAGRPWLRDEHYGSHAHATTAKQPEGIGCAV